MRGPYLDTIAYEIELLTEALHAESVCETECRRLAHVAHGRRLDWLAHELDAHADTEQRLVERLARRIRDLGGQPPVCVPAAAPALELDGEAMLGLLDEERRVERRALHACTDVASRLAAADPDARAVLEEALACERAHLAQLARLIPH